MFLTIEHLDSIKTEIIEIIREKQPNANIEFLKNVSKDGMFQHRVFKFTIGLLLIILDKYNPQYTCDYTNNDRFFCIEVEADKEIEQNEIDLINNIVCAFFKKLILLKYDLTINDNIVRVKINTLF